MKNLVLTFLFILFEHGYSAIGVAASSIKLGSPEVGITLEYSCVGELRKIITTVVEKSPEQIVYKTNIFLKGRKEGIFSRTTLNPWHIPLGLYDRRISLSGEAVGSRILKVKGSLREITKLTTGKTLRGTYVVSTGNKSSGKSLKLTVSKATRPSKIAGAGQIYLIQGVEVSLVDGKLEESPFFRKYSPSLGIVTYVGTGRSPKTECSLVRLTKK